MTRSVVTPERFATGMTFDDYVKWTGNAENLAREGFGSYFADGGSIGAARRDNSAVFRARPAQRPAGRRHQVAGRAAERTREDPGDLGGLVVRLPARRPDAGAAGGGRRAGDADLQSRRPEDSRHAAP